jgi:hypothetical protein
LLDGRWRESVVVAVEAAYLLVTECGHGEWCVDEEVQHGSGIFCPEVAQDSQEECEEHVVPKDSRQFEGQLADDFILFGLALSFGPVEPFPIDRHLLSFYSLNINCDIVDIVVLPNDHLSIWSRGCHSAGYCCGPPCTCRAVLECTVAGSCPCGKGFPFGFGEWRLGIRCASFRCCRLLELLNGG